MSSISRVIYLLIGIAIFVTCGWLTVVAVSSLVENPSRTEFGIPISVWIGTLGSISASGIFFTVSETLRWFFDAAVSRNYKRLLFYKDTLGIKDCFSQKGSENARQDYGSAIAAARYRVWAFGISNGEFLSEHLATLISKKQSTPALDICICFIDPDTKIQFNDSHDMAQLSQVQLYDIARDEVLVADNSPRVANRVQYAVSQIDEAGVDIAIKLVSSPGYMSAMVVDDILYVFPFTAVSKDNTRTPYLKVMTASQLGEELLLFFENVKNHNKLSRLPL